MLDPRDDDDELEDRIVVDGATGTGGEVVSEGRVEESPLYDKGAVGAPVVEVSLIEDDPVRGDTGKDEVQFLGPVGTGTVEVRFPGMVGTMIVVVPEPEGVVMVLEVGDEGLVDELKKGTGG